MAGLRLAGVGPPKAPIVVFDPYVPLSLRWDVGSSETLYWRTGNLRTSFLEIGVDRDTHALAKITCVLAPTDRSNVDAPARAAAEPGLPIFDTTAWANGAPLTERRAFAVAVRADSVGLIIAAEAARFLMSDRVIVGFDQDGSLARIDVIDLSPTEAENAAQAFASSRLDS